MAVVAEEPGEEAGADKEVAVEEEQEGDNSEAGVAVKVMIDKPDSL